MDTPVTKTSADEPTLRSVDERNKQANDPILRRVEELCALLAGRTEWNPPGTEKRPVRGVMMSLLAPHVTCRTVGPNHFSSRHEKGH